MIEGLLDTLPVPEASPLGGTATEPAVLDAYSALSNAGSMAVSAQMSLETLRNSLSAVTRSSIPGLPILLLTEALRKLNTGNCKHQR